MAKLNWAGVRRASARALAALGAAALVGCSTVAPARTGDGPALWKLADEDTTIYLFGTIHLLPENFAWRTPALDQAIAASDSLVLETVLGSDPMAAAQVMMKLGMAQDLPPLGRARPGREARRARSLDQEHRRAERRARPDGDLGGRPDFARHLVRADGVRPRQGRREGARGELCGRCQAGDRAGDGRAAIRLFRPIVRGVAARLPRGRGRQPRQGARRVRGDAQGVERRRHRRRSPRPSTARPRCRPNCARF